MAGSLVIINGDSAAEVLRRSGLLDANDVPLPWRDVLHDGPVPAGLGLEALSQERARFLAVSMRPDEGEVRLDFADRDALLRRHRDFARVVIWLEHDLYDQLQLLQILDFFTQDGRPDGSLQLVQADDYLGTQTAETIRGFASLEQPVTAAQLALAGRTWRAFRATTPEGMARLLTEDLSALPFLRAAIERLLEEFPDRRSGLPRTEGAALQALDGGTPTPADLFHAVQAQEQARFMGDWSFFTRLDVLAQAPHPVIAGLPLQGFYPRAPNSEREAYLRAPLRLTDMGRKILSGEADFVTVNGIDRWVGGTHLTPANLWRWDPASRQLIRPS